MLQRPLFLALVWLFSLFLHPSTSAGEEKTEFTFTPSWTIEGDEELSEVFNAQPGERFESGEFELGNATFQIISYPNGNDESTEGSYMIFLALLSMPETWDKVAVRFTISSIQTNSRFTKIATYDRPKGLGWLPNTVLLEELKAKQLDRIDWFMNIHILRIVSKDSKVLYQHPLSYKHEHHLEWHITSELLDDMKNATVGKIYELPRDWNREIRYNNDMWTMRIVPNSPDDGSFDVYLVLFALPVNIYSMNVEYKLSCAELNVTSSNRMYFNYKNSYWSWTKDTLTFEDFKKANGTITFVADVELLNYFDRNGYEVVTMAHILPLKEKVSLLEGIVQELNGKVNGSGEGNGEIESLQCEFNQTEINEKYQSLFDELQDQKKENEGLRKEIDSLKVKIEQIESEK